MSKKDETAPEAAAEGASVEPVGDPGDQPQAEPEPPHFAQLRGIADRAALAGRQIDVQALGRALHDFANLVGDLMRVRRG